jgi:hypothetical protein
MEWRICPRFPDYEVSEYGQLRRCTKAQGSVVGRVLKGHVRPDGYLVYLIRREGTKRSYLHPKAHQLVIEAFIGPKPHPKAEVRHKDGKRVNDHYSNLEWGSSADNKADMVRHGTRALIQGENHGNAKLTESDVRAIRAMAALGVVQRVIGERYGIQQVQVSRIVRGKQWGHI